MAARLGRECGPAGAVSGAFRRQSLPGGAEGGRRGRRSAPLREREGAARRRLRWRRPSKRGGGAGRGARGESAPAGGAGARPGASSAGSAAEPAAWDMAKAGGAGERGTGRSAGGGRDPGPGEPLARWAEAQGPWRPNRTPGLSIRGSALPASFPRPGSPRGTRYHASPAAEGQVCASPVQSGSWELSLPSERPGSRPRRRDPKGMSRGRRSIPRPATQTRTRPLVLSLCILNATIPHPRCQLGQETRIPGRAQEEYSTAGEPPRPPPDLEVEPRCQVKQAGHLLGSHGLCSLTSSVL